MSHLVRFLWCILLATPSVGAVWAQDFAKNRLVVQVKPALEARFKASPQASGWPELDALNAQSDCYKIETVRAGGRLQFAVFLFSTDQNIPVLIEKYTKTGIFDVVEPDFIGQSAGQEMCAPPDLMPNDGFFSRQWGLHNNGSFTLSPAVAGRDIKMPAAWDITTGDTAVTVCILDSGCKLDHPDLAGRIWRNTAETANGLDDDGNGLVDDLQGWDYANNDNNPTDDHGHGTNITGIIGATGNNNLGYAGVDWRCKLMVVKGLDATNSGFYTWWASGVYYAVEKGAKVINMSLVGTSASTILQNAIDYAWSNGVLIVAAMGNENVETPRYPAAYANLVAVGSINPNGARSAPFFWSTTSGSNYGNHIDVVAPGNYIYSLAYNSNTNYGTYWGGTSQATPHVVGVAALLLAANRQLSVARLKTLLLTSTDDLVGPIAEDVAGFDKFFGFGLINAQKALNNALVGVEEAEIVSLPWRIFPNPAADKVYMDFSTLPLPVETVTVFDGLGRIVAILQQPGSLGSLSLSGFQAGLYGVQIKDMAGRIALQKLWVK